MTRVLVVDDEKAMAEAMAEELSARHLETTVLTSADEAFSMVTGGGVDVVVTDLNMRGMSGVDLCERVVTNRPDVPVIVVTAFGSMETAVATLRAGAFDFLTKPFEMEQLVITVERAVQQKLLREEVKGSAPSPRNRDPSRRSSEKAT